MAARIDGPAMPPQPNSVEAPPLSPKELGIIRQWILEGAAAGSGAAKMVINWGPVPAEIHSSYSLALSPHADLAAVSRANQIHVYDVASQSEVARLKDTSLATLKFNDQPLYPRWSRTPGLRPRIGVSSLREDVGKQWLPSD